MHEKAIVVLMEARDHIESDLRGSRADVRDAEETAYRLAADLTKREAAAERKLAELSETIEMLRQLATTGLSKATPFAAELKALGDGKQVAPSVEFDFEAYGRFPTKMRTAIESECRPLSLDGLCALTGAEWLRVPSFGNGSLALLKEFVRKYGRHLGDTKR